MKKQHIITAFMVALFFAVLSPLIQDMGYTSRIARFIRLNSSKLGVDL